MYTHNFSSDLISRYPEAGTFIFWGSILILAVLGYLLGSLNFGIILSKIIYKDDIREHGSGNAGATNMLRTHGTVSGVATLVGDALKTFVSILCGALLMNILGAYIAGFFCMVGHIFPLYYGFKGGKGVVVTGVLVALTDIRVFLILITVFLILVIGTKYISLGSVIGVALYPLVLFKVISSSESTTSFHYVGVLFAFIIAGLIIWKHRENLKRIYNHTESKISFKRKKKNEPEKEKTAEKKEENK